MHGISRNASKHSVDEIKREEAHAQGRRRA